MAEKKAPGTAFNTKTQVDTNIYGMKLKGTLIYRYDVTIDGEIRQGDRTFHRDFTKRTKDEYGYEN